jgi:hypothetical protein
MRSSEICWVFPFFFLKRMGQRECLKIPAGVLVLRQLPMVNWVLKVLTFFQSSSRLTPSEIGVRAVHLADGGFEAALSISTHNIERNCDRIDPASFH